jgi:cation:H+ antiporter
LTAVFDFSAFSLQINLAAFAAAGVVVWVAGTRLARYADAIAEITGLGSALIGMLLLGGITSLPEIAVSLTAGLSGNAGLAVNNILGGVAMQVTILAMGDAALRGKALSVVVAPGQAVLLQAVFSSLLLCMVAAGTITRDTAVLGVSVWSIAVLVAAVGMFWVLSRYRDPPPKRPRKEGEGLKPERQPQIALRHAVTMIVITGAGILVAGFVLARTSEAIAFQTGLGQSFVGAILTSTSTSLPEISTVLGAVWLGRYMMAFSDIFGTNIFDLALIFLIDASYSGGPVLNEVGAFSSFAAVLGIAVTLVYAAGLIERHDRTLFGIGIDSWAVISIYFSGVVLLYSLR